MSLDVLTLAAAKKYTDSQKLGSVETKVITWDGNTEGKVSVDSAEDGTRIHTLYKVSDDPVEITNDNIKRISSNSGVPLTGNQVIVQTFTLENDATMTTVGVDETSAIIMVADKDLYLEGNLLAEKGVYFAVITIIETTRTEYIQSLELETVHQIDPKFIPEAPVFVPTTEIPYGGEPAALTKEEGKELYRLAQKHDVIRVLHKGQYITATRFYDTGTESGMSKGFYYFGIYLGATGAYPSMKVLMLVCDPFGEMNMAMEAPLAAYVAYDLSTMLPITTEA